MCHTQWTRILLVLSNNLIDPDMNLAVDWVLKIKYISISCVKHVSSCSAMSLLACWAGCRHIDKLILGRVSFWLAQSLPKETIWAMIYVPCYDMLWVASLVEDAQEFWSAQFSAKEVEREWGHRFRTVMGYAPCFRMCESLGCHSFQLRKLNVNEVTGFVL